MNSSIASLSPTPRNGKHGWYDQFQKHNLLLNNSKAKMLIVGDSLVSNLSRYPEIWRKYFINHGVLNFGIAGDKVQNVFWRVNNFHFSSSLNLKHVFILCGTNNIDHNPPQSIASTIICTGLAFQKKSNKFQVVIIPLLPRDHKHSKRRGIINTLNKLLKFQCLNNGFHFLEFKSNWLNNDDSLNIELFYDDDLHPLRKGNELLAKEIINFYNHSKYTVAYSKPSFRDITSFTFNYADFPPLSSESSTVNSFNSLQSSKLSSNSGFSTQKSFAESVLKSNHTLFPLGTTSTQNSCFSPSAHKSSVASAPVKNVSYFSSNSDNSLGSRTCLAICKANSNPKSNFVLKDHSKSHILPVFVKFAIPMSVSNFCVSSTLSNSSNAMVQKPVLILTHLSLVLVLFVTQNSQALRFLLLLNLPFQFLQQIAIIFLFRFLQSLNLMIQNLLVRLLKHLIFRLFL